MKKKLMAVLLALLLSLGALPVRAWAVRPETGEIAAASGTDTTDGGAPFADCVEHTFYTVRQEAMLARCGETALSGANLQIYNRLRAEITKVADGSLDSSIFKIDTSGLGVSSSGGSLRGIDTSLIFDALLADLPYELYWYDKTNGTEINYISSLGAVVSITFKMPVSQNYALCTADGKKYYTYSPDTEKTGAASAAVKNAQALVSRCAGMSDYDKLIAYRDYICDQVSYNDAAASNGKYPYGDPWQMIYVFDNDPGTNVVCEGYAKAFKYLCDISAFANDIACYTVSGFTPGPHMWNIVRINGESYLVDITNGDMDDGGTVRLDALFLAGASGSVTGGYTIHVPRYEIGGGRYVAAQDIRYTYRNNMKELFGADVLTLAGSGYVPSADPEPAAPPEPSALSFTDLPDWCAAEAQWAADSGIAKGTGGGRFSPGTDCTQAQILTFLYRAAGEPTPAGKAPVAVSADYAGAVNWAYGEGMIDDSFDPKAPCTRAEAVTYIWQALGSQKAAGTGGSAFTDLSADEDCAEAVAWAVEQGITDGFENGDGTSSFRPDRVCTRGQIACLLYRAYN